VVHGSHPKVRHGPFLLLVFYDDIFFRRKDSLVVPEVLIDLVTCSIRAGIVDEDNVVVSVFLHENRSDILDVPLILDVIVTGNHHTDGKLFVLTYIVLLLVVLSLLLSQGAV